MMRALLPLLLLACAAEPLSTAEVFGPEVSPDATLPPPTSITLSGDAFVTVDREILLDVSDALPEEDVFLAVGAAPGEGPCRAWLGGYCLGLERPVDLAARAVADGDGRAQFTLPAGRWVGAEYCYQAMVRRGPMGIASGFSEVLCVEHCSVEDDDDDGICNAFDVCPGGRDDLDSDGDGICDALDLCPDDVGAPDADGDGVCDAEDLCPGDDHADEDGDGVCDGLDLCPGDDAADEDGDGICDGLDFGDGIGFDGLEWTGNLRDVSVSPDGSVSLLAEDGGELYVTCYNSDGSAYAGPVAVGDEGDVSNVSGIYRSRVSGHTLVTWRGYGGPVEELRYAHLNPDCSLNVYEGVLWDNDYVEFHDAAIADDGRAVVTYSDGATWVAFLDATGGVLRTEEAFDIGAAYGGHVAINKVTGAGVVGGQVHSGNGIYYRRFDAGFGWVDGAAVHMDTGNYHYWYDGYTIGMNDRSEFVFLWKSSTTQMDARFFDASGGHVNQISWGVPDIGFGWDSFRARHSEIPLRGDNFILGDVYSSGGDVVNHYEYTPAGALVSTSDTTTFVSQGLSIRTDGSGTALLREGNTLEVRLDYP